MEYSLRKTGLMLSFSMKLRPRKWKWWIGDREQEIGSNKCFLFKISFSSFSFFSGYKVIY